MMGDTQLCAEAWGSGRSGLQGPGRSDPSSGDRAARVGSGSGGCTYRAIAVHQDRDGAKQHAQMGFHEGWGTVVDQLVEHVRGS